MRRPKKNTGLVRITTQEHSAGDFWLQQGVVYDIPNCTATEQQESVPVRERTPELDLDQFYHANHPVEYGIGRLSVRLLETTDDDDKSQFINEFPDAKVCHFNSLFVVPGC